MSDSSPLRVLTCLSTERGMYCRKDLYGIIRSRVGWMYCIHPAHTHPSDCSDFS